MIQSGGEPPCNNWRTFRNTTNPKHQCYANAGKAIWGSDLKKKQTKKGRSNRNRQWRPNTYYTPRELLMPPQPPMFGPAPAMFHPQQMAFNPMGYTPMCGFYPRMTPSHVQNPYHLPLQPQLRHQQAQPMNPANTLDGLPLWPVNRQAAAPLSEEHSRYDSHPRVKLELDKSWAEA